MEFTKKDKDELNKQVQETLRSSWKYLYEMEAGDLYKRDVAKEMHISEDKMYKLWNPDYTFDIRLSFIFGFCFATDTSIEAVLKRIGKSADQYRRQMQLVRGKTRKAK